MEEKKICKKTFRYSQEIQNKMIQIFNYVNGVEIDKVHNKSYRSDTIRVALRMLYKNQHLLNVETGRGGIYHYFLNTYRNNGYSHVEIIRELTEGGLLIPIKLCWDGGSVFISRTVETKYHCSNDGDIGQIEFKVSSNDTVMLMLETIFDIKQVEVLAEKEIEYDLKDEVKNTSYLKVYIM